MDLKKLTLRELVRRIDELGHERVYAEIERRRCRLMPLDSDATGEERE